MSINNKNRKFRSPDILIGAVVVFCVVVFLGFVTVVVLDSQGVFNGDAAALMSIL